jgi:asparagine synthase (glutamine-hydrolysing)
MCGITLLLNDTFSNLSALKHRGPHDHNEVYVRGHTMIFDRLAINDTSDKGRQPFCIHNSWSMCNGEIFNHRMLKQVHDFITNSKSDCEIIHHLILQYDMNNLHQCFRELDGDFAFIFVSDSHIIAARDPMGVRPLYIAKNERLEIIGFASEAKAFQNAHSVIHFPPGHYWVNNTLVSYQPLPLYSHISHVETNRTKAINKIRILMYESIFKRIQNTDQSIAFFLSGGLDSSIIAAVAAKISHPHKIETYSIGTSEEDSPDLIAAQKVADYIGSNHHVISFSPETLFDKIETTVRAIESYDCTTVRASVPMYALSEYISKHTNHKVILSGEGADELFGGYLYFHHAPNVNEFQAETIRLCRDVHMYDVLRADRCTAAHGLELRVPFFDKTFVDYVLSIDPVWKIIPENGGMEKMILREAFRDHLPDTVINRQKNGMSDAVGYGWVDFVRERCLHFKFSNASYAVNEPTSAEERYYRELFESMYGHLNLVPIEHVWRPRWTNETDPSARKLVPFKSD